MGNLISESMAAAVGRRIGGRVSFPVGASDIRKWCIAVYWPEQPPERFRNGLVAPADFNPFAWNTASVVSGAGEATPDRMSPSFTERAVGAEPPPLAFQLNGELAEEYGEAIVPGDVITSETVLHGYTESVGAMGPMLVTTHEDVWTNDSGSFVRRRLISIIRY